ncbi:MAG: hypothetical protein HZA48_09460 [Planctomycetes bacterium]|nr:hypothetical protein [Planctomycetota bacterium]
MSILKCLIILLIGTGFFAKILKRTSKRHLPVSELLELSAAFALAGFTLLTIVLAFAGILYESVIWIIVALMAAVSFREIPLLAKQTAGAVVYKISNAGWFEKTSLLIIFVMVFLSAVLWFQPVVEKDALMYKMSAPKLFAEHHEALLSPDLSMAYNRWGAIFLTTLGTAAGGESGAFFFTNIAGLFLLLAMYNFFRQERLRMLCLLGTAVTPLLWWNLSWHADDVAPALYTVLALKYFKNYLERRSVFDAVVFGISFGFGICLKYVPVFMAFPFLSVWAYYFLKSSERRTMLQHAGLAAAIAITLNLPLWIANAAQLGNPFFPFFGTGTGEVAMMSTGEAAEAFDIRPQDTGYGAAFTLFFKLSTYHFRWGPFVLFALPLILLFYRKIPACEKVMGFCSAVALILLFAMLAKAGAALDIFYAIAPAEYAFGFYLGLIPLAARLMDIAHEEFSRIARVAVKAALLGLLVFCLTALVLKVNFIKFKVIAGLADRNAYLIKETYTYKAAGIVSSRKQEITNLLVLDPECYFFDVPVVYSAGMLRNIRWESFKSEQDFQGMLRQKNISHVLFSKRKSFETFFSRDFFEKHPEYLKDDMELLYEDSKVILFKYNEAVK